MSVVLKHNSASRADILGHLRENDASFSPPLSERVDLLEYATKLHSMAELVEGWSGDQDLVGLLAYYVDDFNRSAFITNLSVSAAHRRDGLGRQLVVKAFELLREESVSSVELEVGKADARAVEFYQALGFVWAGGNARLRLVKRVSKEDKGETK